MNSKRIVLGILTLLTLTFAGFAVAQSTDTGADPAGTQSVAGLVVSFENNQLVVRTDQGDQTFQVLSNTTRPATLQANLPVMVSFVAESGGNRAVRIEENTTTSAASETPGGQVAGADEWPGAPSQKDVDDDSSASSGGDDTMAATTDTTGTTGSTSDQTATSGSAYGQSVGSTTTESGTAGSTTESGTAYTDTTGTTTATGSTGQTGSMPDEHADHTMAGNADQSAGTTGSTGSTTGSMSDTTTSMDDQTASETTTGSADQTGTDTMATNDQGESYEGGESLPATGSELPLVGLLGLLALGGAAGIHFGRNA